MTYQENTNGINLEGALPTTDRTGKTLDQYFDFTVIKNGTVNEVVTYEIAAKKEAGNTIDGRYIKLYLTEIVDGGEIEVMAPKTYQEVASANTATGRPQGMMSLATGVYEIGNIEKHYRLRMWVSEEYNPQGDGGGLTFSVKINVYGKVGIEQSGSLLKGNYTDSSDTDFHVAKYKNATTMIVTKKDNTVPDSAIESWDVSEAGDGSVMAYSEEETSGSSTYKITIGGKDGIQAAEDMSYYFYKFPSLKSNRFIGS